MSDSTKELTVHHLMFSYIGLGMHVAAGVFIAISVLVAPLSLVGGLAVLWVVGGVHSLRVWREKLARPLLVAMGVSVAWILALTFR